MMKLEKLIEQVILESPKVNFMGNSFALKVDVNEDPKKKGIKIQFLPTEFGKINQTQQNDIAIDLGTKLEDGLSKYGLRVERDRDLKDPTIIGFFIYIEYISKLVRKALKPKEDVN